MSDKHRPWTERTLIKTVRHVASKNTITERLLVDAKYRRKLFLSAGLAIDIFWAAINLVAGIFFMSVWPFMLGAYYLLLLAMRGTLLNRLHRSNNGGCRDTAGIEKLCGALFLLSAFVLSGIVCLVMLGEGGFVYPGLLIYAVAAFTFYSLIIAIVNYARLHRHDDILVVLNCRVNLSVVLVSIFSLEVAMFAEFGTDADAGLQYVMSIITGAVIAVILVDMGIRSVINAKKTLKNIQDKQSH